MHRRKAFPIIVILFATGIALAGVVKSLPFMPEIDEDIFVGSAARIATTGNMNPKWFGNPGSTLIYPLALIYSLPALRPEPSLIHEYNPSHAPYYLAGRLLSIAYFVAAVVLVYLLGEHVFGRRAGVVGAWFFSIMPIVVSHSQFVRTDSAATFFGLVALLLIIRALEFPNVRNQTLAAGAVGLAVATKYYMISLAPLLFAANVINLWHGRLPWRSMLYVTTIGAGTAIAAFVISNPYLLLDFETVRRDLLTELRPTHLGADGLSSLDNLTWYFTTALPTNLTLPIVTLAAFGLAAVVRNRRPDRVLLAIFTLLFLATINASSLHWYRWTVQVIPVLCLFAGEALVRSESRLAELLKLPKWSFCIILSLVSFLPLYQLIRHDLHEARTTHINARVWLLEHIAPGTKIASDRYGAALIDTPFFARDFYSLAVGGDIKSYTRAGYRYLIASSAMYERYLAEPARYPRETAFYENLFASGRLRAIFAPKDHWKIMPRALARDCVCSLPQTAGPATIRVYEIPEDQIAHDSSTRRPDDPAR